MFENSKPNIKSKYEVGSIRMLHLAERPDPWFIIVDAFEIGETKLYRVLHLVSNKVDVLSENYVKSCSRSINSNNYGVKKNESTNRRNKDRSE